MCAGCTVYSVRCTHYARYIQPCKSFAMQNLNSVSHVCLLFLCPVLWFIPLFAFDMTHGQCVVIHNARQTLYNQDKVFTKRNSGRKRKRETTKACAFVTARKCITKFLTFQNVPYELCIQYATPLARTPFMKYEVLLL